jgi:hemerythrin superfamily protein
MMEELTMANDVEIWDHMTKDHARIIGFLEGLRVSFGKEPSVIRQAFERFRWTLEKHFFTEERAIFTFLKQEDETGGMINDILREHSEILGMLDALGKDIDDERHIDITGLSDLLVRHSQFEEKVLYPRLDRELSAEHKRFILGRITSIVE